MSSTLGTQVSGICQGFTNYLGFLAKHVQPMSKIYQRSHPIRKQHERGHTQSLHELLKLLALLEPVSFFCLTFSYICICLYVPSIPANASGMLRLDTVLSCLFSSATMVQRWLKCFDECVAGCHLLSGRSSPTLAYKGSPHESVFILASTVWGRGLETLTQLVCGTSSVIVNHY